jgi:hypothetical protein
MFPHVNGKLDQRNRHTVFAPLPLDLWVRRMEADSDVGLCPDPFLAGEADQPQNASGDAGSNGQHRVALGCLARPQVGDLADREQRGRLCLRQLPFWLRRGDFFQQQVLNALIRNRGFREVLQEPVLLRSRHL